MLDDQEFSFRTDFGGFPFLSDQFNASRLLAAVAVRRAKRLSASGEAAHINGHADLVTLLSPPNALKVRTLETHSNVQQIHHYALSPQQIGQVSEAQQLIITAMPAWKQLISLPLSFRGLADSPAISASSFAYPQHIFLAPESFASPTELMEQILHETSHNWLYLIGEIWALQHAQRHTLLTLPSGTADREPGEVLGATHVVRNLIRLYESLPELEVASRRLQELWEYYRGCEQLIDQVRPELTFIGKELEEDLRERLYEEQPYV
ncbi:aKG-HExxH-type peptide beta-hydroxylase [Streptomyces sp. NPDC006285]|uniref:aKG-HExxH-type peptide beta-hydroxylase n=1 Tax=Streptomyces sp. NPDC006285 TaxID=3364742 RepID=UPI0036AA08E9